MGLDDQKTILNNVADPNGVLGQCMQSGFPGRYLEAGECNFLTPGYAKTQTFEAIP